MAFTHSADMKGPNVACEWYGMPVRLDSNLHSLHSICKHPQRPNLVYWTLGIDWLDARRGIWVCPSRSTIASPGPTESLHRPGAPPVMAGRWTGRWTGRKRKKKALIPDEVPAATRLFLQVVRDSSDVFIPLKSVVGGLLKVDELIKVSSYCVFPGGKY